jgi:riboflavin synthase
MFTGIVEEIGRIDFLRVLGEQALIEIAAHRVLGDLKPGDSVAVNGVCLTVTQKTACQFQAEISRETLERSTFPRLRAGDPVNLERALLPTSRLGGHFVQGHVDGVGTVESIREEKRFAMLVIAVPSSCQRWLAEKGSVAVNGISLTIARLTGLLFEVAVIPHTLENTTLKLLKAGDPVNIECDILAKYVEALSAKHEDSIPKSSLTVAALKEKGF